MKFERKYKKGTRKTMKTVDKNSVYVLKLLL